MACPVLLPPRATPYVDSSTGAAPRRQGLHRGSAGRTPNLFLASWCCVGAVGWRPLRKLLRLAPVSRCMVSLRPVRALAVLLLCLWPCSALAQTATGADADALTAEVDRDYASALAADCTMACQALDSMRRATEHLCAVDPGDRCAQAQRKLGDATAHVRAACPGCDATLRDEEATKGGAAPPPPPAPAAKEAPPRVTVAEEAQVSKRGGCAGCATSSPSGGNLAPLGAVVLGLLALRRRTHR